MHDHESPPAIAMAYLIARDLMSLHQRIPADRLKLAPAIAVDTAMIEGAHG